MEIHKNTRSLLLGAIIIYVSITCCDDGYVFCSTTPPKNLNLHAIKTARQNVMGRDRFSFILLGDSRGNPTIFQRVLQEAAQHKPDFIIHTGDLTNWGRYEEYMEAVEIIKDCQIPIICIIGNHDRYGKYAIALFRRIFGPLDFYFDIGRYWFICLDNNDKKIDSSFKILKRVLKNIAEEQI